MSIFIPNYLQLKENVIFFSLILFESMNFDHFQC